MALVTQTGLFPEDSLRGPGGIAALRDLGSRASVCERCDLCKTRTNVVFGEGYSNRPKVAFVGEAPGMHEDEQGRPFVGGGGKLLDKMITAMGLKRADVYMFNVVNCRPPENRKPEPEEIDSCKLFRLGQLRVVQPLVLVTLGATATQSVVNSKKSIEDLRGRWLEWKDTSKGASTYGLVIPVRATYHPNYLLSKPKLKKETWKDLQIVLNWIDRKKETET
jgi:uracil-DNA glycosylase family 4